MIRSIVRDPATNERNFRFEAVYCGGVFYSYEAPLQYLFRTGLRKILFWCALLVRQQAGEPAAGAHPKHYLLAGLC